LYLLTLTELFPTSHGIIRQLYRWSGVARYRKTRYS